MQAQQASLAANGTTVGTASSSSDCLRVGQIRSGDPVPCFGRKSESGYADAPVFSALIQSFRDPPRQAVQLVTRLRAIAVSKEIIVNDDSHGQQATWWLPLLTGPNEFYISSPNLHEVRAYNRLAQMARGEFLVFVQGDTCLPSAPVWADDAVRLFRALPRLAMLSGRVGFDAVLSWEMSQAYRNERTYGGTPYRPIDHVVSTTGQFACLGRRVCVPSGGVPFRFAPGVDNGPLFYRRDALLRVGGFDESYSCAPGRLSGHYDFELSLRFWIQGWQVGVFYGGATNGVGGRKTQRNRQARDERHRNELWNGRRIEKLWAAHNATIAERLTESVRRHLTHLSPEQQEAMRNSSMARVGKLAKGECYRGIAEGLPSADGASAAVVKQKRRGGRISHAGAR